jgi:hypothetical protein
MAIADSYVDYTASVQNISTFNGNMTVKYVSADSTDGRQAVYRSMSLNSTEFNDSDIQLRIKSAATIVASVWRGQLQKDSDNPTFDDTDFVGDTYNFRYKPTRRIGPSYGPGDFNPARFEVVDTTVEDSDEITITQSLVALDSAGKEEATAGFVMDRERLINKLESLGKLDSALDYFSTRELYHASWDASAGAAFDFSTDGVASAGIKTVQRVAEGTYRVIWSTPQSSTNYTITTGVGAENYTGTGASPRQLTVISRAVDSLQVHCERTDDAVDEDNAYMSIIMVATDNRNTRNVEFNEAQGFLLADSSMKELQTNVLGYNDSDFASFFQG